jgi:rod shape-determining protein MreD
MLNAGIHSEPNVEVHKYYSGTVLGTVTIYFGVSRRSPSRGLLLGATIGLIQDALSHDYPIGLYGISKTIVGYLASSVGARIDTEHPIARFGLIFVLFHFHQAVVVFTLRVLLNHSTPFFTLRLFLDSLVTAGVGVVLFALLDRLRRSS